MPVTLFWLYYQSSVINSVSLFRSIRERMFYVMFGCIFPCFCLFQLRWIWIARPAMLASMIQLVRSVYKLVYLGVKPRILLCHIAFFYWWTGESAKKTEANTLGQKLCVFFALFHTWQLFQWWSCRLFVSLCHKDKLFGWKMHITGVKKRVNDIFNVNFSIHTLTVYNHMEIEGEKQRAIRTCRQKCSGVWT